MPLIAVIDSGIDSAFARTIPQEKIKSIELQGNEFVEVSIPDSSDEFGHGTKVISYLHYLLPTASIISVKILDHNGNAESLVLAKALEYLLHQNVDLIHMSLSVTKKDSHCRSIKRICKQLWLQGKVIVCSVENGAHNSFPANLPYVVGVRGGVFEDKYGMHTSSSLARNVLCDATPVVAYTHNLALDYLTGNSKAACIATAMIAEAIIQFPTASIRKLLSSYKRVSYFELDSFEGQTINKAPRFEENSFWDVSKAEWDACKIFFCEKKTLNSLPLMQISSDLNIQKIDQLLKSIEMREKVIIPRVGLSYHDLVWIQCLWKYVDRAIGGRNEQI